MNRKKLSPIIACYKDEQAIPIMYERLVAVFEKLGVDYEIIFVNDSSPDNSEQVLTELAQNDGKVVVINHTRNFGSQNAFTSGMKVATGDAVILLDGDLQDPPEVIEQFYYKWIEGFDVVYGVRVKREAPLLMQLSYKIFYRIFHMLSYIPIPVDAGDFSLLSRKVVDILNNLPEKNRFMRGLRSWVGFKQAGVPYVRPERMFGHTTNSLIKNMGWARKAIFSFSYAPLDFITLLAFISMGISLLFMVIQIVLKILYPASAPKGFASLAVLVLFIGGIQLLCLSIIGSYLAQIYDEVKRRPPYIVKNIINGPKK